MANTLRPIFQVGKGGVNDNMCEQISNALEARELIKLRVLDNCDLNAKEAAQIISEETDSDVREKLLRRAYMPVVYRRKGSAVYPELFDSFHRGSSIFL